jgi:hypothetical protein
MNKHCTSWTYNTIRVQEEGSTVCEHHCIFYLIHRCAGKSMGDASRSSGSVFPIKAEGTFDLLGSLFLVYSPLKTFLVLGCVQYVVDL